MIHRDRTHIAIPLSLQSLECKTSLLTIIDDLSSGDETRIKLGRKKITAKYYRGEQFDSDGNKIQDVAIALRDLYGKKCAFCESKKHDPQVEHFRPKKGVNQSPGHRGYYWLSYEWTNLLPCCTDCNKKKGTSFPIFNNHQRVYDATFLLNHNVCIDSHSFLNAPLIDEQPQILHPEFDNPENYFSFNSKGEISGIDPDNRGETTKEKLGLDRDDLNFFRQKAIDHCVELVGMALLVPGDGTFIEVLTKLRTLALDKDIEYTLLHCHIYTRFTEIIIPLLPTNVRNRATQLYNVNFTPL